MMASSKKPSSEFIQNAYEIVVDYSGYSTLAGLIYVFMPNQPFIGKIFWSICIILMLALGIYWSWYLYNDWQENPVRTTVTSTALPVSQVDFPAVTICSQGYDMSVFDAAFFKLLFDFVQSVGGPTQTFSPLTAAMINNKQLLSNLTAAENAILTATNDLQKTYWPRFLNKSFPGLDPVYVTDVNALDWMIVLLNQKDPDTYVSSFALQDRCKQYPNNSCIDLVLNPLLNEATFQEFGAYIGAVHGILGSVDFTSVFQAAFTILWNAKLPCFDTVGMTANVEGERGVLKKCSWKGKTVPCSAIFTTFPTDQGMCCSFNMKAANEIFMDSQYSALVKSLQFRDQNTSFEDSTLPDWFINKNEPRTQPGRNMGLKVVLDAHSNVLESLSISRDFEGFTGLVTNPGSFPLTELKGFEIRPGHNNRVAVSAVMIDADDSLRDLEPDTRKCLFSDETDRIKLHKTYNQANCFLECALLFAQNQLKAENNLSNACTPWYFPFVDNGYSLCDPWQTVRIMEIMESDVPDGECNYCLPNCIQTIYQQTVSAQPFRRCDERNLQLSDMCNMNYPDVIRPEIWGRQVLENFQQTQGNIPSYLSFVDSSKRTIKNSYVLTNFFRGLTKDYDAYEKDIAVLEVFFDTSTVMKFQSQKSQSWLDYLSSVGGALGLCIGLSIITVVELVWLCLRIAGQFKSEPMDKDEVTPFT